MRSAFVSHSTSDDSFVAEMESFLRASGFDEVFNDVSSIRPDERLWSAIEKGIADADTVYVVITTASNASEWVKREVEHARSLSKKIIPVWREDCPIPPIFADRDVIDFRPRTREERRFDISRIVKYAPAELIGREDETQPPQGRLAESPSASKKAARTSSPSSRWAAKARPRWSPSGPRSWRHQDWPGCDAAFAWSFYSQGTREQTAASSDLFLKEALTFFGDARTFAASAQARSRKAGGWPASWASGAPAHPRRPGAAAIRAHLAHAGPAQGPGHRRAAQGPGRRQPRPVPRHHPVLPPRLAGVLADHRPGGEAGAPAPAPPACILRPAQGKPAPRVPFNREQANEFEHLVEEVNGHALTLQLMGGYLKRAFAGDVRCHDRVRFAKADAKDQGGHAFRAMAAYEKWLEGKSDEARRELAILRLMGLFDRPATSDCVAALRTAPAIAGLTEPLVGLAEEDWNASLDALESAKLLAVHREKGAGTLVSLDAHPLLREYFGQRLRDTTARGVASSAPAALRAPLRDHEGRRRAHRSKISNRCIKPWPTAARRGCSRRRATRFTGTASARDSEALQHA